MSSLTCDPEDVIQLWTRNGPCEIQLLSGDITKLPLEDEVDIIMVSAFPGDYAPMSTTVIGALKKNLGINVMNLSYDKEFDLRHNFSCWLSKPLQEPGSPYKKLLCFERIRAREFNQDASAILTMQIRDMFRVFVPVFNNQDNTVITPLLATGHQGHSPLAVCCTMVKAAAHWIEAGLPLRCFKIVIYSGVKGDIKQAFAELKSKLLARNAKMKDTIFNKKFDVYITFSPADNSVVKSIKSGLQKHKSNIKVYAEETQYKDNKVWQDDAFKAMVACKRIIAVLSRAFLESSQCLELYNMAMCCNRLFGVDVLVPFYIETVDNMPTYMGLVQWIDCRIRKDGDTAEGKLTGACLGIIEIIDKPDSDITKKTTSAVASSSTDKFLYDVFISYSHKTPTHAEALLNTFKSIDENVKVFYDRSALTTGSNWQNMLYQCLGESRCVITLLSPTYLSSVVCMEEYNLALARFLSKDKDMLLVPLCIEKTDELPASLSQVQVRNGLDDFDQVAKELAGSVCEWLKNTQQDKDGLKTISEPVDIEAIYSNYRTQELNKQYRMVSVMKDYKFQRMVPLQLAKRDNPQIEESQVDIALIYANDSFHLAGTFCAVSDQMYPGLNISVLSEGDQKRLEALDKAKKIVIFISQDFLKSDFHMQELHLALCRQRPTDDKIIYLIKATRSVGRPFFPRILPYNVACTDTIWEDHEKTFARGRRDLKKFVKAPHAERFNAKIGNSYVCDYRQYFAMVKAVEDVLESIVKDNDKRDPTDQLLLNPVTVEMLYGGTTIQTQASPLTKDMSPTMTTPPSIKDRPPTQDTPPTESHSKKDELLTAKVIEESPEKDNPESAANQNTKSAPISKLEKSTRSGGEAQIGSSENPSSAVCTNGDPITDSSLAKNSISSTTTGDKSNQQSIELAESSGDKTTKTSKSCIVL